MRGVPQLVDGFSWSEQFPYLVTMPVAEALTGHFNFPQVFAQVVTILRQVHDRFQLLHGDISFNNLVMHDSHAYVIDWEFVSSTTTLDGCSTRSGTKRFMARAGQWMCADCMVGRGWM